MGNLHLQVLSIGLLLILFFTDVFADKSPECFYTEHESCTEILKDGKSCDIKRTDSRTMQVFCCNITHEQQIKTFLESPMPDDRELSGIHIRDSNLTSFNFNVFDNLKNLASVSITNSSISRLGLTFDKGSTGVTCLNISYNTMNEVNPEVIMKLAGLRRLVIRNNTNFTTIPFFPLTRSFIEVDVSENNNLSCRSLVNLTEVSFQKNINIILLNKKSTICLPPNILFKNAFYVTMDQVDKVTEIYKYCPNTSDGKNCSCKVYSLDATNETFVYQAMVNCSGKELTSLPKRLPPYTRVLDVSNNKITSLEGIGNTTYDNIKEMYADNNNIGSLGPLEGTKFLENFQNLSLTQNKIEQIQEHMFTNVFDRNFGRSMLLANNYFKCECRTATNTKAWLNKFKATVHDYTEVFTVCDEVTLRVIDMVQKDYCPYNTSFGSYLKYLIAAEISIFVLLIGKVSYDYYVFKTYGYLPWPASRMPKLPCDWCFET